MFWTFWPANVLRATAACVFFDIKPPKSGPYPSVFPHFDLQMCFAPQRRAIFADRNFKNGSRNEVFCTFWLDKCASRHSGVPFSDIGTSKSAPTRQVFCSIFTYKCAFATAACHFSPVCWTATSAPAALASLLFEHQEARFIEKTQRFATSLTFRARVPAF